jgi:hypothetical protein
MLQHRLTREAANRRMGVLKLRYNLSVIKREPPPGALRAQKLRVEPEAFLSSPLLS